MHIHVTTQRMSNTKRWSECTEDKVNSEDTHVHIKRKSKECKDRGKGVGIYSFLRVRLKHQHEVSNLHLGEARLLPNELSIQSNGRQRHTRERDGQGDGERGQTGTALLRCTAHIKAKRSSAKSRRQNDTKRRCGNANITADALTKRCSPFGAQSYADSDLQRGEEDHGLRK